MAIERENLLLSVQRGLLKHVAPNLRAVCVKYEDYKIYVYFYYDGKIKESDKELAESVMDDIISDFHIDREGNSIGFDINILQIDFPQPVPLKGDWVYFRYE